MVVYHKPVALYLSISFCRKINAVRKGPGTRAKGDKSIRNKHGRNVEEERRREMHLQEMHQMFLDTKKAT